MSELCDTCLHNHGVYCSGEACADGDAYLPRRPKILHCGFCGGILSEIRTDGIRMWRHCYSCHFEFEESGGEQDA